MSVFLGRAASSKSSHDGIRIGGGAISSGYPHGLSRFEISSLSNTDSITIPKHHKANLLVVARASKGELTLVAATDSIYLNSDDGTFECYWNRGGNWPVAFDEVFERTVQGTILVNRALLAGRLFFMSRGLSIEATKVSLKIVGDKAAIVHTGLLESYPYVLPVRAIRAEHPNPLSDDWSAYVNATDYCDAVSAVNSETVAIGILACGLVIENVDSSPRSRTVIMESNPS